MAKTNKPKPLALATPAMSLIGNAMAAGGLSSSLSRLTPLNLLDLLDMIVVAASDNRMINQSSQFSTQYYLIDLQIYQKD